MKKTPKTPKQHDAIRILETWLYSLYESQEYPIGFTMWQSVKSLIHKSHLDKHELSFLSELWDEYVKYKKEKDAR